MEKRRLTSTTLLNEYLDWPHVGQVFELERTRLCNGQTSTEIVYGLSSLKRDDASADDLLFLQRQHWGIENGLHYVRDETLGEDRCRVRKGNGASILAALRNLTVHLLAGVDAASKAAATRRFAAHPEEAMALVLS